MARVSRVKRGVVGINWNLRYRLKIEDQEHTIDDLSLMLAVRKKIKTTS